MAGLRRKCNLWKSKAANHDQVSVHLSRISDTPSLCKWSEASQTASSQKSTLLWVGDRLTPNEGWATGSHPSHSQAHVHMQARQQCGRQYTCTHLDAQRCGRCTGGMDTPRHRGHVGGRRNCMHTCSARCSGGSMQATRWDVKRRCNCWGACSHMPFSRLFRVDPHASALAPTTLPRALFRGSPPPEAYSDRVIEARSASRRAPSGPETGTHARTHAPNSTAATLYLRDVSICVPGMSKS